MKTEYRSQVGRDRLELILAVLFDEAPHALDGRTYVQKLTFLLQKEADTCGFVFEPHDYGPFSHELYSTLDYLIENDYITEHEEERENGQIRYCYEAGPWIEKVFGHGGHDDLRDAAQTVFDEYSTDDLGELLEEYCSLIQSSDRPLIGPHSVR